MNKLDSLIFISKLGWLTCASSRQRSASLRAAADARAVSQRAQAAVVVGKGARMKMCKPLGVSQFGGIGFRGDAGKIRE